MTDFVGIKAGQVNAMWHLAEPHLRSAIDRTEGYITDESAQEACRGKTNQLWLMVDGNEVVGAALTEVRNLRTGETTAHILAMGAENLYHAFNCENTLTAWARSQGATRLTMDGRKGFLRKLKDWRFVSVFMEKKLDG